MSAYERYLPEIQAMVAPIANEYGRKAFTWGADFSDFAQELYGWCWVNQDKVEEWLSEGDERGEKMLAKALRNECKDYMLDIKAQNAGYERRDLYFYTVGELKILLDSVFDQEAWLNPPQSEGRTVKSPAEGNNWIATLADVASGFKKLNTADQELLRDFHELGWRNSDLAQVKGVSEAVMSYRHSAAVGRLLKHLGGTAPKPMKRSETDPAWRGRHSITNAAARAIQDSYYAEG